MLLDTTLPEQLCSHLTPSQPALDHLYAEEADFGMHEDGDSTLASRTDLAEPLLS